MNYPSLRQTQILSRDIRDLMIAGHFHHGYPMFAVTHDSQAMCHKCCRTESKSIGFTTGTDGWALVDTSVNWENESLTCAHCGDSIQSAYGADA